ncbi:solute carrier family 66 member 2 isoform X2 [Aphidius gifuensis]|uniref:solute carrier family 66 member 2 isoform X2 n=1 Tax=Aphidius gifuensis TaxID=684658 RepID=UPI001CDBDCE1|nr:solute carrier family 66 member 2 isoform X2 [Aphidius gifuensis]
MYKILEEMTIKDIADRLAEGVMIFGGIIPYIPQYIEIKQKDDADGFSLYVCLALLIANTLRIFFWFGKRFEKPLLVQSILMNITMLIMIRVCVTVRNKNQIIRSKDRVFTDFQSYAEFFLLFGVLGGLLTYLFVDCQVFVEIIGFLAVLTEAVLGVPQFCQNLQNKSTDGMSKAMVAMWTAGDVFKTGYFYWRESPIQFTICGGLQVFIDLAILFQIYIYRIISPLRPELRTD